jgi:hypothetical protein
MSSASSLTVKDVDIYDTTADVDHHDLYDESCTLLSHQQSSVENQIPKLKPTPIPKLQLATLCLVRYIASIVLSIAAWLISCSQTSGTHRFYPDISVDQRSSGKV